MNQFVNIVLWCIESDMKKKRKKKKIVPDEVVEHGPFRMARFGSTTIMESNWPGDSHAQMIQKAADNFPEVVNKIDGLVQSIANLVSEIRPEGLLHRAWWEYSAIALRLDGDTESAPEDLVSSRMIDYLQSIIASVPPAERQRVAATDEEWSALYGMVRDLFHAVTLKYHISHSAKSQIEDDQYDPYLDEFHVKAQMHWCNVRGNRYQSHVVPYLRDVLSPHSEILLELFSVDAEEIIGGLEKIWYSLTFGIGDVYEELESFREDTLDAVKELIDGAADEDGKEFSDLMQRVIEENGWKDRQEQLAERFSGLGLFDVAAISGLPDQLIAELTWKPGEDSEFFAGDEFQGWPLKIWPVFKRPFIELDGRSCCFDIHTLFDNIYRVLQRTCKRLKKSCAKDWNIAQKEQSERLPLQYLQSILPGAVVYPSVYYKWYPNPSEKKKQWCEADGILVYDDHLFILEIRAGAFTYTSPADDFPAFVDSLKNLVLKPATQGRRFLEYLEDQDSVAVFDENHDEIATLSRGNYRKVAICAVTLDPFTELAAQVQHLNKIEVDVGTRPVWSLSLDDLRIYADVFSNPLLFLHYVEQRMLSFESDAVRLDDEIDHLGLYLKHNNYTMHAEEMSKGIGGKAIFNGYRTEIDKFYAERLHDPTTSCPLKQKMPERIFEIVAFLSESSVPKRTELSSYLLDLDSETRSQIASHIERELELQQSTKRPKPFSSYGGVDFTVFCYRQLCTSRHSSDALYHAQTVKMVNDGGERLLLELVYSNNGELVDLFWQWVSFDGLSEQEYAELQTAAEMLRRKRLDRALTQRRKIGRNEPCPCGSGKKYKKCCLK